MKGNVEQQRWSTKNVNPSFQNARLLQWPSETQDVGLNHVRVWFDLFTEASLLGVVKSGRSRSKEEIYLRPPRQMWGWGLCRSKSSGGQQRNTNSISRQRRKYEIRVSADGGKIGLIAGDKYGSQGQLAHTSLLSLGEWGLPLSPRRVWLLSGR